MSVQLPEPPAPPAGKRDLNALVDLYRFAFDEGRLALSDQLAELDGIRNRAVSFASFVFAATAFLVGTGIKGTPPGQRHVGFYALSIGASLVSVGAILCLTYLLYPYFKGDWHQRLSASKIITKYVEPEVPPPTAAHVYRRLSEKLDQMRYENENFLRRVRLSYAALASLGCVQVLAWSALVWKAA